MTAAISRVEWQTWKDALMAIRHAVFVTEQGVPVELEHDEYDAGAAHLLATTGDGKPIGTARMLADGHIGRMAVLPPWRGQGVGTAMLQELLRIAEHRGDTRVFLHAQCAAVPFYERLGFVAEGDVFLDAGIEHQCMYRDVAGIQD